jgi:polar amino acid transport system substrate-binding protein
MILPLTKESFRLILTSLCCLFLLNCGGKSKSFDYQIAMDSSWYGLGMMGREANLTAFTNELIEAIGKAEKVSIAVSDRSWSNLMYALQKGECDAICSTMQPYLFYEKLYHFSNIFLMTGPVLVIPVQSPVEPLEKMKGKIIAVQRDSNGAAILEKYPEIILRTYDSVQQALTDMTEGMIDGALVDVLSAEAFTNDLFRGQLKIASMPLTQEGVRILTLKDHTPQLIKIFDRGLAKLKADGTYSKLAKKWNLAEPSKL